LTFLEVDNYVFTSIICPNITTLMLRVDNF
jgi:hypothetical protein